MALAVRVAAPSDATVTGTAVGGMNPDPRLGLTKSLFEPQQYTAPPWPRAQVKLSPSATSTALSLPGSVTAVAEARLSTGDPPPAPTLGFDCEALLAPQQNTLPSLRITQA